MGAQSEAKWGPGALVDTVREQLDKRGFDAPDAARSASQLAAAVGPAARASHFVDLGACHFLTGNVTGALAAWKQAAASGEPAPSARALFNLGLFHEEVGLRDLAVEMHSAVRQHGVEPYASLSALAAARAHADAQNHEQALRTLERLVHELGDRSPNSALLGRALLGSGDIAERLRDFDRAASAYRAATKIDDDETRSAGTIALIRVLRLVGRDDEAQQFVDATSLDGGDPSVAVDRVELLIRLDRVDDAIDTVGELDSSRLSAPDRFRLVSVLLEIGLVNRAIDDLEELSLLDSAQTQARASYLLGEVYLAHDMHEPARMMLESVSSIQPGYWADKATLALGDLAFALGDVSGAASHWANAAASSVESVASGARRRLVDALETAQTPFGGDAGASANAVFANGTHTDARGDTGHDSAARHQAERISLRNQDVESTGLLADSSRAGLANAAPRWRDDDEALSAPQVVSLRGVRSSQNGGVGSSGVGSSGVDPARLPDDVPTDGEPVRGGFGAFSRLT